jgi:hypothetical protein
MDSAGGCDDHAVALEVLDKRLVDLGFARVRSLDRQEGDLGLGLSQQQCVVGERGWPLGCRPSR